MCEDSIRACRKPFRRLSKRYRTVSEVLGRNSRKFDRKFARGRDPGGRWLKRYRIDQGVKRREPF
jgi:hypothetical protein